MQKLLRKTLTLLCVGVAVPLFSQTWTQTTSLFEAPVTSINIVSDPVTLLTTTYAAFKGTGVLVSTDGYTWTNPGNAGLTETSIERLSYINNTLYAGTHGFLFASTDGAASWASVSLGGMPANPTIFDIGLFISIDPVTQIATSILLAATDKGIYSRTGNAPNWNQVGAKSFEVRKLLVIPAGPTWPAAILAGSSSNANGGGSGGDIWRSTDGVTFTRLNLTAWSFRALEQDPLTGTIYAGGRYKFFAPGGVFISHDGGQTFSAPQLSTKSISSVGFNGATIYLGTNDGILFSSVDQGSTWQVNQNPSGKTILSLNYPFEGSDGIWRLDDQSHAVTNTVGQVSQVIPLPDDTIYRSQFFGIWSSNQGYLGLGSESSSEVNDRMIQNASGEVVITKLGVSYNLVQDPVSGLRSLVKSNLNGQRSILGLKLFSDGSILAGDWAGYVYKSVDGGYTWQKVRGPSRDFHTTSPKAKMRMGIW